jgi:uncharacterized protein YbjT (DUF2867 family)
MRMILVTGATGNAGGGAVNGLLELGAKVRGLVRPGTDAELPDGVEAAVGDLNDPETLRAPLEGVSAVFLLSGYDGIERALALMGEAGVERVVLLSSSAAPTGDLTNAVARYHILSERAVRGSGLPWTFLQPNSLMSNAYRWLPELAGGNVVHGPFGDVAIATIDPDDLGAVAARALTTADHEGKAYRLSGPEALRPAEQVEIMAQATGREMRFEAWSDEEARAEMEKAMPKEYVDAFFSFFADGTVDETTVHPTVRDLTGREPRSFERWVHEHADAFRSPG